MAWKRIKIGENEFEISTGKYWMVIVGLIALFVIITAAMSFYTIDANERGVILRFGKYTKSTRPGLHWKFPWNIDKLYKVKVDYQYKEEFGFRTLRAGVKSRYAEDRYTDESWLLNGDLNISDVKWVVQYSIKDPVAFLFKVRDVQGTIRDVSESAMRLVVGDHSFHETLQTERRKIALVVKDIIQAVLDDYHLGVNIELVQLKDVHPPDPVRPSFNEVNEAKQEQETVINEARKQFNKEIYRAKGEAQRVVQEAHGYAINRTNRAEGDAQLFNSIFTAYRKAPSVTEKRLYLETMEEIMGKVKRKYLLDKDLQGVLPLMDISGKEVLK